MPDVQHVALGVGEAHEVQYWQTASAAARAALVVSEAQAGRICRQLDDNTYWILRKVTGGVIWSRIDMEGSPLSSGAPVSVDAAAASAGASTDGSRADHKHSISTGVPVDIGLSNASGSATSLARSDHTHKLSAVDRAKLDASGPTTPLASTTPAIMNKAAAVIGISPDAARADHKHDVSTAAPSSVGTANAEGSSASLARADHVHDHGAQALGTGTQHAEASTTVAGFMSGADKTKLNGIAPGATAGPTVTAATPAAVTKAAAAVGVSAEVARADHKHDVSTAAPAAVGAANAEGVATSLARSDHVHDASAKAEKLVTIVSFTSATLNVVLAHLNAALIATGVDEQFAVIPSDATLNLPIGFSTLLVRGAVADVVGFDWDPAVSVLYDTVNLTPECQRPGSSLMAVKIGANSWWLSGEMPDDLGSGGEGA